MAPMRDPGAQMGLFGSLLGFVRALLLERRWYWHFFSLLLLGEAALGVLIIWKVPYTKIDWDAYMQQVEGFLGGQRDYGKLEGETGPLVYPGLHLYIYTALHELLPRANRIRPAQFLYLGLYLLNLTLTATIYYLAGAPALGGPAKSANTRTGTATIRRHIPQILLIPLALSKREHSIYMLRLFNDPIAMTFLYASIIGFMRGGKLSWRIGSVLFSLALGVKMNILLFLPALLLVLFQLRGVFGTLESVSLIALVQILLPAPFFLSSSDHLRSYFSAAFDFSRDFLYEWTVNWRFISFKTFHSKEFAQQLLLLHLVLLVAFGWYRWTPSPGGSWNVLRRGLASPNRAPLARSELPSFHIPLVMFTSNFIGMLCARSLHYQFHTWYFNQLPFLLYLGGAWGGVPLAQGSRLLRRVSLILGPAVWLALEWAWSLAKVTPTSSGILLACHLVILAGLWQNGPKATTRPAGAKATKIA